MAQTQQTTTASEHMAARETSALASLCAEVTELLAAGERLQAIGASAAMEYHLGRLRAALTVLQYEATEHGR